MHAATARRPLTTDEDQGATFVELFFDLVFVYGVTQVVGLIHDDLTWEGAGRALLVFWLLWWAWTQFAWALNSADTTHPSVKAVVLVATGVAFLMAVVVPDAFGGAGAWFAGTYVAVRAIGLALYARVAHEDPAKRAAVRLFAAASCAGLGAVAAGGAVDGDARVWLWASAIALDLVAAGLAGRAEGWDIRPEHFGERHGLFVIIVLGESLIAAASGLTGAERTAEWVAVAVLAVAATTGLWWAYFATTKPFLDRALASRDGPERSALARDAYSVLHFPLVFGVVVLAVALEEMVAHPDEALPAAGSIALAGGVALVLLGSAAALVRAGCALPGARLAAVVAIGAGVWATGDAVAPWSLAVVVAGLAAVAVTGRVPDGPSVRPPQSS